MKKIIIVLLIILTLFGCGLKNTPKDVVENYLDKYNTLDDNVLNDLQTSIANENLSQTNANTYKEILTRQYKDLKYEIKDESIDGNNALVTVKITVYDLYKSQKDSELYMNENINDFYDINNMFDNELYMKHKLSQMLKQDKTIDYEITFYLENIEQEWVLKEPNRDVIEKIHGLYNYENN